MSTVHNPFDTRILFRECTSLSKNGYVVSLMVSSDAPVDAEGVNVVAFPKSAGRLQRMTSTAYLFVKKAAQLDEDIYHFHDPELVLWMWVLRIRGKKVIFDVHENIVGSLSDRPWIPGIFVPIVSLVTRWILPVLMKPYFIVFAEKSYPSNYPWVKNYEVVCNFPNLEKFPVQDPSKKFDTFSIVYVGSISEPRGIIEVLDALALLQKRDIIIDFYLIGQSNIASGKDLLTLTSERSLTRVHVMGYLPQPEALKIISKCHVGLAILHPVKNYMNSYPTKLFEYMGCSVPFITSNFPLYQEIVEKWNCGSTVDPNCVMEIAEEIDAMRKDLNELGEMGRRGRQAVELEYNWCWEEKKLLAAYDRLGKS